MVRLTVAVKASPRELSHLLEAFRYLILATRLEAGCGGCSTWADPDGSVHYTEEWRTEDDMRRRVLSDRFVQLLAVLESAAEQPLVQFDFVTRTRGLDYVTEARQAVNRGTEDL
jgi:quinol monooxygenase YgiN